jgi:pumilio RNA-binding family
MYPQVMQSNANEPSPMYVNPSYGGGYAAMQYHKAYPQAQVMHAHDSNMNSRIPHPQYITAIPIHGISGQSNGGYIYFQQPGPGPGMAPVPSHHAQHIGIDATGQQAKIVSPGRMQVPGRSPSKAPSAIGGKVEKTGRKATRNSRKGPNAASIDGSRHSLSSGTLNLLEDYRSSKDKSWTATDVKGHIVEFCQDQNGSRFVQQRLEVANDDEKAFIVSEVLPAVKILRNDVFGNYVVQKLFEHCNYDLKTQLKQTLVGEMVELSSQIYGCRVVQKALEKMNDDDLIDLLTEFHVSVLACIHDQNGNHVIQKIIEIVSYRSRTYQADSQKRAVNFSKELQFILDCAVKNIVSLSCHPFGCRVMQRILEHCVDSQKSAALECIQKHLRALFDDQYGNYVIQHVLQFGRKSDRDIVLQIVIENGILGLSRQKFASNVIEKLLKYGNGAHRNAIVREMLKMVDDKTVESGQCTIVLLMVRDAYANYVVQTTLDVVPEGNDKELLLQELRNNSSKLVSCEPRLRPPTFDNLRKDSHLIFSLPLIQRNYTFAKHIITKLEEADGKLNSRV